MKKKMVFWMLVFCLFLSMNGCKTVQNVSYAYQGNVNVVVNFGVREELPLGKKIPICISVDGAFGNPGHTVAVTVPTNSSDYYKYQKKMTAVGKQNIYFLLPVAQESDQLVIEILNEQNRVIYSRTCHYHFTDSDEWDGELVIGMISEQKSADWSFVYLYNDERYAVRAVQLRPETLVERADLYEGYSLLVIDKAAIHLLGKAEKNALCRFANLGGNLLVLGNAEDANALGLDTQNERSREQFGDLTAKQIVSYRLEEGKFWLFDGDIFPLIEEEQELQFLNIVFEQNLSEELYRKKNRERLALTVIEVLEEQTQEAAPADKKRYIIIFAVYLFLIQPGIYYVLKKKDRLRFFRRSVCIVACLVSVIVWTAGNKTRFTEPFLHSITFRDYSERAVAKEYVYISVQAPFNEGYEVSIDPNYFVMALTGYETWSASAQSNPQRQTAILEQHEDETIVRLENLVAFSPRYFEAVSKLENDAGISGSLSLEQGVLTGTLKNETGSDLEAIRLEVGGIVYQIKEWKAGEEWSLQSGSCESIRLSQYIEGLYRVSETNETQYEKLYQTILQQKRQSLDDMVQVMARVKEPTQSIQEKTEYAQSGPTFIYTKIPLKDGT